MIDKARNWLGWALCNLAVNVIATKEVRTRFLHAVDAEVKLMRRPESGPYDPGDTA